ncbi:DNA helicase [Paenibacillus sp. SC116]|uniref:DnaB-like helicase C-terminal domain-containing protein n=1 Tax=Paenibacillus sp. SC116 TaxID=2968986 RepID=UPI00215AFAA1|nr:DnaB-like helicase C-terminal domain-containing protein [Paenibacillus sp. SC116]MCR8843134.1 DNA helicase [Paenibacillus sp. SC116]
MANYGEQFLSRIIDDNDVQAFIRFNIVDSDFPTQVERKASRFIRAYAEQNSGQAPSYATFVAENPEIVYIPDVTDSFEYMTKNIKSMSAKVQAKTYIEENYAKIFEGNDGITAVETLKKHLEGIIMRTSVRDVVGTDIKKDAEAFLHEYQKRKDGESFRTWSSKFISVLRAIGPYVGGNMYTWYGRSGRGKSVCVMEDGALEPATQGANVLVWSMEMPEFQWMARAYSSLSARDNLVQAEINGQIFAAGFENKALLLGKLPEEFEEGLYSFLGNLNDTLAGNIYLRAVDHEDFTDRSLRALEADIIATKADVVVIDPFYYLDYEKNTSKTTGGDAAATSMKLRRLAGKYGVVMHVITQADEVKDDRDDEGKRELTPPKRAEIMKTKQVLQDAAVVLGVDSLSDEGRGIISLGKGRDGGEDTEVEIVYLPNYGIVREAESDQEAQFNVCF